MHPLFGAWLIPHLINQRPRGQSRSLLPSLRHSQGIDGSTRDRSMWVTELRGLWLIVS